MSKVTSKLQITLPKVLANRYSIRPGDEIEWEAAADVIRLIPSNAVRKADPERRLEIFDQATERQRVRNRRARKGKPVSGERGWTRDSLYTRGRPR